MANGVTEVTSVNDAMETFIADADFIREHKGIMKGLVDKKDLPKRKGTTWNEPYFGSISAQALYDGDEFDSPTEITDDKITITPGEVGVQVLWTNRMALTITEEFARIAADLCMNAIEYKIDTDLLGQLDSFSTAIGGSTTSLSAGLISAGRATLMGGRTGTKRTGARTTGEPAPLPINAVIHPFGEHDLAMQLAGVSGAPTQYTTTAIPGNFGGQSLTEYNRKNLEEAYVAKVRGVNVYCDGNLTIASNAVKGGVFAKRAIVMVNFQGVQEYRVRTVDGRAVRHTVWVDYGFGERADNWGVELAHDATAPTT